MRPDGFQQGNGKNMLQEFKAFIARGNVLDLAVAVIIGAAFGAVVTSFTEDMVMPIIGLVSGGADFTSLFVVLGDIPADYKGSPTDYEALKKAGVPLFGYGKFVTAFINFIIIAFVIFLMVKAANKAMAKPAEAPAEPPGPTPSEALLAEIRDELRKGRG
jgi:large conductance mechanosensitive channel